MTSLWSAHIHRQTQPCYQVLDGNELLSEKNETEVKKLRKVRTVAFERVAIVAVLHCIPVWAKHCNSTISCWNIATFIAWP